MKDTGIPAWSSKKYLGFPVALHSLKLTVNNLTLADFSHRKQMVGFTSLTVPGLIICLSLLKR